MTNTIAMVISALIAVESGGDPAAVGDDGQAVGILQMWPCAVEEANRLAGRHLWTREDRHNPQLSWAMAWKILEHHYQRGHTDAVSLACRWHSPYGEAPESYVEKVRSVVGQI